MFSVRQMKMPLLTNLLTPGLRALHFSGTRSASSGTLHIKDPLNFWCGSRVDLKDVKSKSEPVCEPATGNVLAKNLKRIAQSDFASSRDLNHFLSYC